jgi:hypothetical protein
MLIPPSIIDIQKRAELCLPILRFITDTFQHIRDPIAKVLDRINDLRNLKTQILKKHTKEVVENFLSVVCIRD